MMKNILLSLSIITLTSSCSVETEDIPKLVVGQDFTNTSVRVISIDTFDVELSTFKLDSLVTSGTNRLLLGQYEDEYFGRIKSSTYFELNASNFSIHEDAELDSVGLILGYDSYFYNDTTNLSRIKVHSLTDFLKPDESEFYNTSEVPFNTNEITTFEFYPEPNRDSIYIPLPVNFGDNLFQELIDNIDSNDDLVHQFKGMALLPDASNNSSIVGFSTIKTETYVRFFYKVPDINSTDDRVFDLFITRGKTKHFNKIQNVNPNQNLQYLTNQDINLPSNQINNLSYYQSGTGYVTRVTFPSINNIFNIPGEGTVLNADLLLKPDPDTYSETRPLTDSLLIYVVDQNNDISLQIKHSYGLAYGKINNNDTEFNDLYYNIPVLRYIDRKMGQSPVINDALIFLPRDYDSSVSRILFMDQNHNSAFTTKLIITYAIYEEEED
ncbi:DUF4270 family protein [Xanthomarina gelatinilytica]|uniref:DUF4270 family protein n=1 Tax=Xanthomarina gelatinilytica TaxID=1137281 RepID=UPI003AA7E171